MARDLVLVVGSVPEANSSAGVRRREMLGGKGANQAVGLSQLGNRPALVAVVGDDQVGTDLIGQAQADGIDVTGVVRRQGAETGLIVDVVDRDGKWRYLEDLPAPVLLTEADVMRAAEAVRGATWVSVQLQQPIEAVRAALALAGESGAKVVLDGVPAEDAEGVLAKADVLRADAHEAELLTGTSIEGPDDALRAGRELLEKGPSLVALAADPFGNLVLWEGGHVLVPLLERRVVDTTGAGDAFVAGLITALARAESPERAARLAGAAAAATVGHPGGRPDLNDGSLDHYLDLARKARKAG